MTCEEARDLIGALVDGELDLRTCAGLERHLAGCPACAAEREALLALREGVREKLPAHPLPAGLEDRLRSALRGASPVRPLRRAARSWPLVALPAAAAAAAAVLLLARAPAGLAEPAFEAHLRSLQAAHLVDVPSSDSHTVKPWFAGRLDYAVPTPDLSAEGAALEGGRLDHLGGRPVAALVYRVRRHAVNLFVWPAEGGKAQRIERARGLTAVSWSSGGFERWLVSDLAEPELLRLAAALGAAR